MPLARRPVYAKKEDYHTRPEQSSKNGRLALPSVGARSFRLLKSKTSKQDLSASTSASVSAMPMNTRECGLLTVANPWGILISLQRNEVRAQVDPRAAFRARLELAPSDSHAASSANALQFTGMHQAGR